MRAVTTPRLPRADDGIGEQAVAPAVVRLAGDGRGGGTPLPSPREHDVTGADEMARWVAAVATSPCIAECIIHFAVLGISGARGEWRGRGVADTFMGFTTVSRPLGLRVRPLLGEDVADVGRHTGATRRLGLRQTVRTEVVVPSSRRPLAPPPFTRPRLQVISEAIVHGVIDRPTCVDGGAAVGGADEVPHATRRAEDGAGTRQGVTVGGHVE